MSEKIFASNGVQAYVESESGHYEFRKDKSFPNGAISYTVVMSDGPMLKALLLKYARRAEAGALFDKKKQN